MFVLGHPFQSGLRILRARPELTKLEHLSDASFLGKLLVFLPNDRLDLKVIASCKRSSLLGLVVSDEGISFITLTPGQRLDGFFEFVDFPLRRFSFPPLGQVGQAGFSLLVKKRDLSPWTVLPTLHFRLYLRMGPLS